MHTFFSMENVDLIFLNFSFFPLNFFALFSTDFLVKKYKIYAGSLTVEFFYVFFLRISFLSSLTFNFLFPDKIDKKVLRENFTVFSFFYL